MRMTRISRGRGEAVDKLNDHLACEHIQLRLLLRLREAFVDLQLTGKRALVTGSSSGIGEATAKRLAEEGCVVAVHGRNRARAERVAEDIRMAGGQAIVAIGDLADEDQARTACEKVDYLLGGIDILFNNVGGIGRLPNLRGLPDFSGSRSDQWLADYQANVVSAVRVAQYFVSGMKERGWGRIIQNSSAVGTTPRDSLNEYSCAKAALLNLTVGLAKVLAGTGITVNTISPGMILTPQALASDVTFLHRYASSKGWDYTRPLEVTR